MQLQRLSKLIEQKQTHASPRHALQPPAQKHLLLQLQQTLGNQAFLQLLRSGVLQTKLEVRKPGDVNELVAEQFAQLAQRVIRTRGPDEKSDNEFLVEAKETPRSVTEVAPAARRRLKASRGGGQPKRAANAEKASPLQTKKESESLPDVDKGAAKESAGEAAVAKETPPPPAIPGEETESAAEAAPGKGIARAPATPAKDPSFQEAKKHVRAEAKKQKKHDLADVKRAETEKASALKEDEQVDQSSKEKSTEEMRRVGAEQQNEVKNFSAQKFKDDLMIRINAKRPETESEAKAFAKEQPVEHFEADFSNEVAKEQGKVTRPLEEKAQPKPTGGVAEKPVVEVPKPAFPPAPKPVDPKLATPKPKTDQEISLEHESDRLDGAMQENDLSDDQLAESREPSFIETLKTKEQAKKKVAEAPDVYRQREAEILKKAEGDTNDSLATELGGMSKVHQKIGGDVHGGQKKTETETEKRQREIKETIDGIYQGTVDAVKGILADMVSKVKDDFANALKQQTNIFNENVRSRISDYYGDWRIDDKLFGPADVVVLPNGKTRPMTLEETFGVVKNKKTINPDVYEIFVEEKDAFLKAMDLQLDIIANNVQAGLTAAHNQIQIGKTAIAIFKATLKGSELIYATQLEEEVKVKFENLESSIDDAREDLLQTLAEQYTENVNQLEKTFNEINDELKKSWLDRAIEFIETVAKTIFQLAELLLSILVRVAHLVWDIIKHPIRFFETLVSGLKEGIAKFIDNIGTYLQEAFWTWITGATPVKNIRLSAGSGIESLFDLVMQVLNLGPAELRAIVEKILGKEFMEMVDKAMDFGEKALEPVIILLKEGPLAFWRYIQDTLGSIIQSSFDRIKETVFDAFVEKGLKWIAGFFIPGGGFVKIVKAIVSAFQFVAENLENIRHFFDSVFDAMEAAVAGRTEGVVSKIITGLKTGVVLALDFLAKQLGLNKIIDSVQKIIQSLRRPIVNAIEWILRKVKPLVMKLMAKGKELVAKGKAALGLGPDKEAEAESPVVTFTAAGEQHKLWTELRAGKAVLMVASNGATFDAFITKLGESIDGVTDEAKKTELQGKITQAKKIADETELDFARVADLIKAEKSSEAKQKEGEVKGDEENVANLLRSILDSLPSVPTGLSKEDAIPITWFKVRSLYVESIELSRGGVKGMSINRDTPTKIPVGLEPRESVHPYQTRPPVSRLQEITMGVPAQYWPRIGKTMQYIPEERGNAVDQVRAVLDYYGFRRRELGVQMDHVQDLQFEGPDIPPNVWPYDSSANMSAGPRQRDQIVIYADKKGEPAQSAKTNELPGRYFKINKIGI